MKTMLTTLCVWVGLLFPFQIAGAAEEDSDLAFLKVGRDYVIVFASPVSMFRHSSVHMSTATSRDDAGKVVSTTPVATTLTITLDHFRVIEKGGKSWVLLEHAASHEDFAKWDGHCRAKGVLTPANIERLEKDEKGREQLARLREAAERKIKTTRTWINLDQALAITEVSNELIEGPAKLSVIGVTQTSANRQTP